MNKQDILKVLEEANKVSSNASDAKLAHYNKLSKRERTESEREKLSKSSKGRTMPKDAIERIRNANKGRVVTEEQRSKISESLKGRKLTNQTCKKMSQSRMGHGWSEIAIKNIKKAAQKRCVPVSKFTLDGIWIEDFIGLSEAGQSISQKNGRAIQLVCNYYRDNLTKGSKQCGGFIWKYKN
jgi:hypothetical protein